MSKLNKGAIMLRLPRRCCLMASILALVVFRPVSAEALPPGADAFVVSASALAKSSEERVELGRATARLSQIKKALSEKLLAANVPGKFKLVGLEETGLLCDVLRPHLDVATGRNYIQMLSARVAEVGKPTQIDNLVGAIKSLFQNQTLEISGPMNSRAEIDAVVKAQTQRCYTDIKSSAVAYYSLPVTPLLPATVSADDYELPPPVFLGELNTLINLFVSIITPIIVDGAKIVDEERRRAAVQAFLANEKNRERIVAIGGKLADEVSRHALSKRRKAAGLFVDKIAALRAIEIDISKVDSCKEFPNNRFATRPSGAPSDDYVNCWRSVWTSIETTTAATLKAAEEYDQLADAGDTDTAKKAFKEITEALSAIAEGSVTNPDVLWAIATRLVAFGEKVHTAFSKENREKLDKAIEGLMKSL